MKIVDYKYLLANLLLIENDILESYDFDKEKAKMHVGYNKIVELSTEITQIIKNDENEKIIEESFLL